MPANPLLYSLIVLFLFVDVGFVILGNKHSTLPYTLTDSSHKQLKLHNIRWKITTKLPTAMCERRTTMAMCWVMRHNWMKKTKTKEKIPISIDTKNDVNNLNSPTASCSDAIRCHSGLFNACRKPVILCVARYFCVMLTLLIIYSHSDESPQLPLFLSSYPYHVEEKEEKGRTKELFLFRLAVRSYEC